MLFSTRNCMTWVAWLHHVPSISLNSRWKVQRRCLYNCCTLTCVNCCRQMSNCSRMVCCRKDCQLSVVIKTALIRSTFQLHVLITMVWFHLWCCLFSTFIGTQSHVIGLNFEVQWRRAVGPIFFQWTNHRWFTWSSTWRTPSVTN